MLRNIFHKRIKIVRLKLKEDELENQIVFFLLYQTTKIRLIK